MLVNARPDFTPPGLVYRRGMLPEVSKIFVERMKAPAMGEGQIGNPLARRGTGLVVAVHWLFLRAIRLFGNQIIGRNWLNGAAREERHRKEQVKFHPQFMPDSVTEVYCHS